MESVTFEEILSAMEGELWGEIPGELEFSTVSIDSRSAQEGDLFFALVGERLDGHNYLNQAVEKGVGACVISQKMENPTPSMPYIVVKDTTLSLGKLAKWYRNRFQIPFIAVTGSVGKTTAKDMIASVLSSKFTVHKTQGNFNNTIGLPLTLLDLEEKHEICVVELGMDTLGEIDYMAEIVKPNVAIITNVGEAHIQRLGSRENIRKAKYEIVSHLSRGGTLLRDMPVIEEKCRQISLNRLTENPVVVEGNLVSDTELSLYTGRLLKNDGYSGICCSVEGETYYEAVEVPALGTHMLYPTMFAIAVAEIFGLIKEEVLQGVSGYIPSKMRMNQVVLPENVRIFDDCYNANPQSMSASLQVLSDSGAKTKIAVLGDMLELGEFSRGFHEEIGALVADLKIDLLVTIGQQSRFLAEKAMAKGMAQVILCESKEEACGQLKERLSSDSALLIKGSRGMALEEIVSYLRELPQEQWGRK